MVDPPALFFATQSVGKNKKGENSYTIQAPSPKDQNVNSNSPPGPSFQVLSSAKMNRVGLVGCCKPEERLEEKLLSSTYPSHVAPCCPGARYQRELGTGSPLPRRRLGKGQSPATSPGGREPCRSDAYLSFGMNGFPRRRQRSEDRVIRRFQPGVEELRPGEQRPTRLLHTGASGRHPRDSSYRGDSAERRAPSSTFSEETAPLRGLPKPTRTPGPRFGENQGPSPCLRAQQLRRGAKPPLPPPANLKASLWTPAYSSGPAVGSLPWPPALDRAPGALTAAAAAAASPPHHPRPGLCLARPAPHDPALPCSRARAPAVPVSGTRPSRRGSSPGAAPRGVPGSGQGSAGPGAGSAPLAAPAPAPAAARQEGGGVGRGGETPGNSNSWRWSYSCSRAPARRRVRAPAKQTCPRGRL